MMQRRALILALVIAPLTLAACNLAQAPIASTDIPTVVPTAVPTLPLTTMPTAEPSCPVATPGMQLLRNEEMGYCLLYPDGHNRLDPNPTEVCLIPEGPTMACHNANAFINVEDAAGRTAGQVADAVIADQEAAIPGISIERSELTVAGEEAVALEGLSGVDSSRKVVIVHADRLYWLTFVPWDETREGWAGVETLHDTVMNSLTFLPAN